VAHEEKSDEAKEIEETMENALPDELDDDRLEDQEPQEPGLDAV
jgi:hypothetical protein